MPSWRLRPRPVHHHRRLLLLLVLVVGGVLVIGSVLVARDGRRGGGGGKVAAPQHLHHKQHKTHMTQHMAGGPGVVVSVVEEESLLQRLLPGGGAPRIMVTLDMSHPPDPELQCITTRCEPEYPVCPHDSENDRFISEQLLREGTWEPHIVALFTAALAYYPSSTVVDLGAHVGVYSLLGARLGARAVAVEPVWASAVRLQAGAVAGGVADKVTILLHAIADQRFYAKLRYRDGNLGGTSIVETTAREAEAIQRARPHDQVTTLTLDHLYHFVNTSIVLLKIDVEGWECGAVLGGKTFLKEHFVPYIFMEWSVVANNRHKYHAPCRAHTLQRMVDWLASHGYHAHISKSGAPLNPDKLDAWRAGDVYWRHLTSPRLHQGK
nr:uncharacterized protein LOC123755784 [Procambarus clarkii]